MEKTIFIVNIVTLLASNNKYVFNILIKIILDTKIEIQLSGSHL